MADEVLIVGAGPAGLAAALFLSRLGVAARLVDKRSEPNTHTNAMGVNPRTLDLLDETGVTAKILAEALVMKHIVAHQDGERLGEVQLKPETVGGKHPMVIYPQFKVEGLLRDALAERGVHVEWNVELTGLTQDASSVAATLKTADGGTQTVQAPVLLGADGAHSPVRHFLGLDFPGDAFPEPWQILDAHIDVGAGGDVQGYMDFRKAGVFLALPYSPDHWRLISNVGDPAENLPEGWTLKKVDWSSDFKISHRLAEKLQVGRVCLAGDAAHIHAPVGARGMNLGIEDAYVFAHIAAEALKGDIGRLDDYGRIRHEVDGAVVRKVEGLTKLARAKGPVAEEIRPLALPLITHIPPLMHFVTRTATGLDHEVRLS